MSETPEKKEPLVPGGPWKEEELLVCKYSKAEYWVICVVCLGLAVAACVGQFFEMGIVFIIPVLVFGNYIIRCKFVFYPGGVVYRGFFGKVDRFKDEDVLYVTSGGSGKGRYFAIVAEDEVIQLGVQARHFYEAERCAYDRYPSKEEYERRSKQ